MKKTWLITLIGLTLALAATTAGVAALTSGGSTSPAQESVGEPDPSGDQGPVTSIDDIDPNECNWIHNITACEGEPGPGIAVGEPYPLPVDKECGPGATVPITSDGQYLCYDLGGDAGTPGREPGDLTVEPQPPVTSIDDIDPNLCDWVHNINACFSDGQASADIPMDEYRAVLWLAQEDLSQRLAVEIGSIKLVGIERAGWPVYWPEEPEPGVAYIEIALAGFTMLLEADGQTYGYQTDTSERVVFVG